MDYPGLAVVRDGSVLRLVLDRPDKRNALDDAMMDGLLAHLEAAGRDESVRVVVLSGAGDNFCGGADILARNEPRDQKPRVGSIQRRLATQAHRLIVTVLSVQTPVVAVVRGWAVGIGFHLALAADFAVVSRTARLWEPFVGRGFTPDSGGTWLLPRLLGTARAKEILMLGRELSGEEAAALGLVLRAVGDQEVEEAAGALVDELAQAPTVSVGLTKWLVHQGAGLDLERHLANEAFAMELSSRSQDFREGLAAFRERRAPRFEGR